MANNLDIQERTLAQISDSTNSINQHGSQAERVRKSVYQPIVCRITDHDNDTTSETDDADKMAIFCSIRHGEPWIQGKKDMQQEHITHQANAGADNTPSNVTVLFPNFDYSEFS